jgi:hypothetical protein
MFYIGSQYIVNQRLITLPLSMAPEPLRDFCIHSDANLLCLGTPFDQLSILKKLIIKRRNI